MPKHGNKNKRKFKLGELPVYATQPAAGSPMQKITEEDGVRVRTYPNLYAFVRPLVAGEFENIPVVSPERMRVATHVLVSRLDPDSVSRTRIPITTEQAAMYEAFGVLERAELQSVSMAPTQGNSRSYGPFVLPDETQRLTLVAASQGIRTAMQEYPNPERKATKLEERARHITEMQVQCWSDIANDLELYARLFVPAFVFGYRYGNELLNEAKGAKQQQLVKSVCTMEMPAALQLIQQILRNQMRDMGVDSLYQLL
jgi:hypothetical protein